MNKYIYNVLATYYKEVSESMHITDVDFTFKKINDLCSSRKITLKEKESLFNDVTKTLEKALEIISDCPYIKICIGNSNNNNLNNYYLN